MDNYFLLSGINADNLASAFAPDGTKSSYELIPELEGSEALPFELELVKLTKSKSGIVKSQDLSNVKEVWLDYQPNSLGWPLMSESLKFIIDSSITGKEGLGWIRVIVRNKKEQKIYYILRFEKLLDVLCNEKTTFIPGTDNVIKPFFSISKIRNYHIFHLPSANGLWKITSRIYVSESLKKALQKNKVSGICFEKISSVG